MIRDLIDTSQGFHNRGYKFPKGDLNPAKRLEVRIKISDAKKNKPNWKSDNHLTKENDVRIKRQSESIKKFYRTEAGRKKIENWKKINIVSFRKETCRGEKNYFWKGGVTDEHRAMTNSAEWRKIAENIMRRDNFECRICKKKDVELTVHHLIPWRISKDNSPKNLITLCKSCHTKTENKFRRYGVTHYVEQLIKENGERIQL
jgi:hypothetical protein